jgi:hypothetical protein
LVSDVGGLAVQKLRQAVQNQPADFFHRQMPALYCVVAGAYVQHWLSLLGERDAEEPSGLRVGLVCTRKATQR